MQNRYVGDIGDFGKYGLLRALCSDNEPYEVPSLPLGVIWYLVPDEGHNGDGKFVQYLNPSSGNQQAFRDCDHALYDTLGEIVWSGARNVTAIRDKGILPSETRFFDVPLTFAGLRGAGVRALERRIELRTIWIENALQATAGSQVVFLDPDNGFEVKVGPHQPRGPKYTYFKEMVPFVWRGQTLVVYQHIARQGSAKDQITRRLLQIKDQLLRPAFALLYHRGSARAFFVIPAESHRNVLLARLDSFLRTPWERHFELVTLT